MAYEVLARKWRPRTFAQVVGQRPVLQVLRQAFEKDRLHHAYLFTGTRGVGKTTLARIVAKMLNCEAVSDGEACGACAACRGIDSGGFPDLIEVDAASRTRVEEMRELLQDTGYMPTQGRYKIYLIDEVHMLSAHSFNALLKTLEEPPEHIKFLLATTDPQKLPATILSRCLQFHLKRLTADEIEGQLRLILAEEGMAFEDEALMLLSRAADGSMRDGLSLLDQAINYCEGGIKGEEVVRMLGQLPRENFSSLVDALARRAPQDMFQAVEALRQHAPSCQDILTDLARLWHCCALSAAGVPPAEDMRPWVEALCAAYQPSDLQLGYQILLQGRQELPYAPDDATGLQMTLLRLLCFVPDDESQADTAQDPAATAEASAPTRAPAATPPADPAPATRAQKGEWGGEIDWSRLTDELGLRGRARILARHCVLEKTDDDGLSLVCESEYPDELEQMLAVQGQLGRALRDYYGRPVKLSIRSGKASRESRARQEERERNETRQQDFARAEEDPLGQDLQKEFGAQRIGVRDLDTPSP